MAPPMGEDNPIVRECGSKWGAKKALIHFRDCMLEQGDTPVEEWTSAHDLLCIMLDLGADAGVEDGMKRKAGWNCTSKSVQALLSSDWELGEKTVKGHLVETCGSEEGPGERICREALLLCASQSVQQSPHHGPAVP